MSMLGAGGPASDLMSVEHLMKRRSPSDVDDLSAAEATRHLGDKIMLSLLHARDINGNGAHNSAPSMVSSA